MAKTALTLRWSIAVLVCVLLGSAHGQDPLRIREILDGVAEDVRANASAPGMSIESLRSLDALEVQGRHRFILPLPQSEGKLAADRLADSLQRLGILEAVDAAIGRYADQAERQDDPSAVGLRAVLHADRGRMDGETIRVARSSAPLSLLAWNSGSFAEATTPHFLIASQAGERPTLEMAQACELAYRVWALLFAESWSFEQKDAPKLDGAAAHGPFRVAMFRTRDAYLKSLRAIEPKIGVSTGYYSPEHRMSFFYWDGPKSLPTLVHELTHQFFQEWGGQRPLLNTNDDPGFWAIEGVAMYVESLSMQKIGGAVIVDVGGWDAPRLQAGRYRRLHDEYWVPWESFSQLDGKSFRNSEEISAWYSQSCGLAHFWMDGSDEDRARFIGYLKSVYAGQGADAAVELARDDDALRSDYDRFLMTSWRTTGNGSRTFFPNRRDVVLSRCDVASRDLLAWPTECRALDWLDLSFSKVDDLWLLDAGEPTWQVARLNLESTAITDRAMPILSSMRELKELDLTGCKITDQGIAALQAYPHLRQLWLGQTEITDASIGVLLSLPRLERLVVEGSGVSDAGWKRILAKKPHLRPKR